MFIISEILCQQKQSRFLTFLSLNIISISFYNMGFLRTKFTFNKKFPIFIFSYSPLKSAIGTNISLNTTRSNIFHIKLKNKHCFRSFCDLLFYAILILLISSSVCQNNTLEQYLKFKDHLI